MSYEFDPESQSVEFSNPYKVENCAIIVSGAFMLLAGTATMLGVYEHLAHEPDGRAIAIVIISIALLLLGIGLLARAFTRLHFFFGRDRPDSLAPLVAPDQDGDSDEAYSYKETLRQNAIIFREPAGPLNGLLYSWLPKLIFAPEVIQRCAQAQFYTFLILAATFAGFLLCWLLSWRGAGWIGLVYGAFALVQIVRPMEQRREPATAAKAGTGSLVILVLLAVVGPVLLAMVVSVLPDLGDFSINGVVAAALICTLIGCGFFGLALKNQLQPPPQAVGSACASETLTLNVHPHRLLEELERVLMMRWYRRIPNRRYTRRSPWVEGEQGQFSAEIFEERQPRPQHNRNASGVRHALSMPQFFWLTCLSGLAMAYLIAGTLAAVVAARLILAHEPVSIMMAICLSQIAVGMYCYAAAHVLWGRFDFVSELIWVEINGSFESAAAPIGDHFTKARTPRDVVNVESMTMRVWVSEIDTVIFGKDAPRQLIGMGGLQSLADELAASLKVFGAASSMAFAPDLSGELDWVQQIGQMHQFVAGPALSAERLGPARLATANTGARAASSGAAPWASTRQRRYCHYCSTSMDADACFCADCGKTVAT